MRQTVRERERERNVVAGVLFLIFERGEDRNMKTGREKREALIYFERKKKEKKKEKKIGGAEREREEGAVTGCVYKWGRRAGQPGSESIRQPLRLIHISLTLSILFLQRESNNETVEMAHEMERFLLQLLWLAAWLSVGCASHHHHHHHHHHHSHHNSTTEAATTTTTIATDFLYDELPEPGSYIPSNCSTCVHREELRQRNLQVIKDQILSKLGMQAAPNMTGRLPPRIPPLDHLLDLYGMQGDSPSTQSFRPGAVYDEEEDDFHARTEKVIAFTQPCKSCLYFLAYFFAKIKRVEYFLLGPYKRSVFCL